MVYSSPAGQFLFSLIVAGAAVKFYLSRFHTNSDSNSSCPSIPTFILSNTSLLLHIFPIILWALTFSSMAVIMFCLVLSNLGQPNRTYSGESSTPDPEKLTPWNNRAAEHLLHQVHHSIESALVPPWWLVQVASRNIQIRQRIFATTNPSCAVSVTPSGLQSDSQCRQSNAIWPSFSQGHSWDETFSETFIVKSEQRVKSEREIDKTKPDVQRPTEIQRKTKVLVGWYEKFHRILASNNWTTPESRLLQKFPHGYWPTICLRPTSRPFNCWFAPLSSSANWNRQAIFLWTPEYEKRKRMWGLRFSAEEI